MESPQETGFLFLVSYPAIKMGPEAPGASRPTGFPKSIKDKAREALSAAGLRKAAWGRHPEPLNRAGFLDLPLEGSCSGMGCSLVIESLPSMDKPWVPSSALQMVIMKDPSVMLIQPIPVNSGPDIQSLGCHLPSPLLGPYSSLPKALDNVMFLS